MLGDLIYNLNITIIIIIIIPYIMSSLRQPLEGRSKFITLLILSITSFQAIYLF